MKLKIYKLQFFLNILEKNFQTKINIIQNNNETVLKIIIQIQNNDDYIKFYILLSNVLKKK